MAGIYRQRHPERTVFYRVLFHYFDEFVAEYEDRFEKEYGYFRPVIQDVVERYLDCGNPMCGFARIRCPDCGEGFAISIRGKAPKKSGWIIWSLSPESPLTSLTKVRSWCVTTASILMPIGARCVRLKRKPILS